MQINTKFQRKKNTGSRIGIIFIIGFTDSKLLPTLSILFALENSQKVES